MAAAIYDIIIEQGASFKLSLIWKDSGGFPVNLTGYTSRMQVRTAVHDPGAPLLDLASPADITLGGAAGTIDVVAAATKTALITNKKGVYDLELVAPDGFVTRLVKGGVEISHEVTR